METSQECLMNKCSELDWPILFYPISLDSLIRRYSVAADREGLHAANI